MSWYTLSNGRTDLIDAQVEWSYSNGYINYELIASRLDYSGGVTWYYKTPNSNSSYSTVWGTTEEYSITSNKISVSTDSSGYVTTSLPFNVGFYYSYTDPDTKKTYTYFREVTGNLTGVRAYVPSVTLSAPSITANSTIYKPGNSFTVKWTSAPGGSHTQTLVLSGGDKETTVSGISGSSTSHTFESSTMSYYNRGVTLTAKIRAVAGTSGYNNSSYSSSKTVGYVNTLPSVPTISSQSSSNLTSTSSITFNITSSSDSDGQTITLYYSLNGGTKTSFTSPLVINTATSGVQSGNNTILFYSYDGLEYSSSTQATFTATFAPVVASSNISHTYITDMEGYTDTLVKTSTITYSLSSGSVDSIQLHMRTGTTSSLSGSGSIVDIGNAIVLNTVAKTVTISIGKISSSILPYGNYFQFAIRVKDGDGAVSTNTLTWLTVGRRPKQPELPDFISCTNDAVYSGALSNYYKNEVTISGRYKTADSSYAAISQMQIISAYDGKEEITTCSTTNTTFSQKVNLTAVNPGASTSFYFKIIDMAEQEVVTESNKPLAQLTKTTDLVFATSNVVLTPNELKPYSASSNFQISHPMAQASGTSDSGIQYLYKITIGNSVQAISSYTPTTSGDTKYISVTAANMRALVENMVSDNNTTYTATVTITAVDSFGIQKNVNATFTINFTEPPTFVSGTTFRIKHDYYATTSSISSSTGTEVTSSSGMNLRMFNYQEGIIFMLPKATDPNDDISEYRIYLSRNDFTGGDVLSRTDVTFGATPWLTLTSEQLERGASDNYYYYYRYSASQYIKNEYFYFMVQVKDSRGNLSETKISETYIIGCRTVNPNFAVGNVDIQRNGSTVNLGFNFRITDLGGSATSAGWNTSFYDNYPNFERSISGYTPQALLKIEICPDQSFASSNTLSKNITSGSPMRDFTLQSTSFSDFSESNAKVFVRFTLTVSYTLTAAGGTRATVASIPQVYTYFGSIPTISHRAHRVGINTNSFTDEDVFIIENYQGSKYVIFRGTDLGNAGQTYEIKFNLLDGTVDGLSIGGGTW